MESKEIEIRFYLLGDKGIGKDSILSRFKILNCSKTNTSDEDNFSKSLQIEGFNIELKFLPVDNPDEIKFNDSLNEDEEGEFINKSQKYNFAKVVKQLKKYLSREYETRIRIYHVFLFCFDLSKFSSLKTLQIYYNELNVIFNFDLYYQALIGNKLDKKVYIDKDKQNLIDVFLGKIVRKIYTSKSKDSNESNIKHKTETEPRETVMNTEFKVISLNGKMSYYEISTKIFYNFEKFFQRMFDDLLVKIDPLFSNVFFKEKLTNILCIKPSFAKSKREELKVNDYPGPQKYDTNIYSLPENEVKKILSGKGKYNDKIYVNKGGPVFTSEKMELYNKKLDSKKRNHEKSDINREMVMKIPKLDSLPEEYYKKLYNNFRGFTMGIKQPSVGLRRERKKEFDEAYGEQKSFIQSFDNINNPTRRNKSQESIQLDRSTEINELIQRLERVKKSNKKVNIVHKRHAVEEEVRNRILQTSFRERSQEKQSPKKTILPYINTHKPLNKPEKVVGPGDYEIRGNILSNNKGTTFGIKSIIDKRLKAENPVANYVRLSSEFDIIDDHPTFSLADRFSKQNKLKYVPHEDADALLKSYERKSKFREEKIQRIRERKLDKIRSKEKKVYREWEDYLPGPGEYDINYESINGKSPSYTIAGKLDKFNQNGLYDDPNKLFSLEQSVSMLSKNISKALYNLPNHNYIKESPKRVVFNKSERFKESVQKEVSPRIVQESRYIGEPKIQKYDPEKLNSFGKAKRFKRKLLHEYPGPGEYKKDGFAEEVVKMNEKRNQLKEQSIILKKTEQFDKSYNKQNSFESDFSESKEKRIEAKKSEADLLETKENRDSHKKEQLI